MARYQLSISAENIPKRLFRVPRPYAVVKVAEGQNEGTVIGKTEVLEKTRNAEWTTAVFLEADPSRIVRFKVLICDKHKDDRKDILADATFEATEVYVSPGHTQSDTSPGGVTIHVSMEESPKGNAKGSVVLQLRGLDIKNVEPGPLGLGRSDPFFEIARKEVDHSIGYVRWRLVYRSEYISDHLNPYWNPVTLGLEELCFGDLEYPLKVTVKDHNNNRKHTTIGGFETTIKSMADRVAVRGNADRERAFKIFKGDSDSRAIAPEDGTKNRGLIVVVAADLQLERDPAQTEAVEVEYSKAIMAFSET